MTKAKARTKAATTKHLRLTAMALIALFVATALTVLAERPAQARDVVVIPGQVSIDQCPADHQAATGILVVIGTGTFTECYAPDPAWDAEQAANREFQSRIDAATAAAQVESEAWAQAHPGEQKCIQWGPVVHSNGVSTASGGVCANPVPLPEDQKMAADASAAPNATGDQQAAGPEVTDAKLTNSYLALATKLPKSSVAGKSISLPKLAGLQLVYRSATPKICSVSANGKSVTAIKPGNCRLTLTLKNSTGTIFSTASVISFKKPS